MRVITHDQAPASTRRDFLKLLALSGLATPKAALAADTAPETSPTTKVLAAIKTIQGGVPGMQARCRYTPIEAPTHLIVMLRQNHEFAPAEALFATAPARTTGPEQSRNHLNDLRDELRQAATFLQRHTLLNDIFCEAVAEDQLAELNAAIRRLRTDGSSPALRRDMQRVLGTDLPKCELIAHSGLTLHAGESRELNQVVTELNRKGFEVAQAAKSMFELESRLRSQYPRHAEIPQRELQLFTEATEQVTKGSDAVVAFWNSPDTQRKIFEERELFALRQISNFLTSRAATTTTPASCPGAILLYGGNHDFTRHLARIHKENPTLRIAFVELTPMSYREPLIKK